MEIFVTGWLQKNYLYNCYAVFFLLFSIIKEDIAESVLCTKLVIDENKNKKTTCSFTFTTEQFDIIHFLFKIFFLSLRSIYFFARYYRDMKL